VTYLVTQTVMFGGSVKRLQGVALLHKNLPVNRQFGAVQFSQHVAVPFWLHTDDVVDPWSRAALSDTPGLEWGMAAEELLHRIVVLLSQFFLRAVTQYRAAHGLHLRLELLKVDTPDVPGGHRALLPQRSRQSQRGKERPVVRQKGSLIRTRRG